MPVYEFHCKECNKTAERFLRLESIDRTQFCATCYEKMERLISAPIVVGDYKPYTCPITGKLIEGKKAHTENLKKHGCRVYEPGETEQFKKRKAQEEASFEKKLDMEVERQISTMDSEKVSQLANEISSGANINVTRT